MGRKQEKVRFWIPAGILVLLFFLARQMPLYEPAPEDPFTGTYWYNPYGNVTPGGQWLRSNFHAHSNSWKFITNGKDNTVGDIVTTYDSLGYDIIGVSDYQHITDTRTVVPATGTEATKNRLFIPVYEHGFNVCKTHQGTIGARMVYWNDYVLPQTRSQKQHILEQLGERSELVVLHHPAWMGGYSKKDVRRLSGYDLFEVLNDFWISEELWDVALSSGKPAMLIAGDDAHNVFKPTDLARDLTMIHAGAQDPLAPEDVYRALKTGAAYGIEVTRSVARGSVVQKRACLDALPVLQSCRIQGDSLVVVLSGKARQFHFIGQDGALLKSVPAGADMAADAAGSAHTPDNAAGVADSAFYLLQEQDRYVRVKIALPDSSHIYLNPVMRTMEKNKKPPMPPVRNRRLFTIFDP